jgi:hypothetical protein
VADEVAGRRHAGAVGGALCVTWHYDLYLSAYPNGFWAFNPLAWQLLFVFGAWCALGGATRMSRILSSRVTLWICFAYLLRHSSSR